MKLTTSFLLSLVTLLSSLAPVTAAESSQGKLSTAESSQGKLSTAESSQGKRPDKPNIIFILTDDQGYGDLARHGHPLLRTPHTDRLHDESVRFDNFYVSPSCAPTRAALMTGMHEFNNGVTHTRDPREHLWKDATLLPQILKTAGYRQATSASGTSAGTMNTTHTAAALTGPSKEPITSIQNSSSTRITTSQST